MSQKQRLCSGVGGCRCGAFMSLLFRDPHPTCSRCRGRKCTADVTCDICNDWSVAHWEAFLKKRSHSGRRKSRPSGSDLPTAPPTLPPSALASSEARRPVHLPRPTPLPPSVRGRGCLGGTEGAPSRYLSWGLLSPLPPFDRRGGGGGFTGAVASGSVGDSAAFPLTGVVVAGSLRSQESLLLAAPSSEASSVSAERDRLSRSRGIGESTEARSRSCSLRSFPSRG